MYDAAEDISKMKEYAIDPPVTLPPWERSHRFICTAHLVTDPKGDHIRAQSLEKWSKEDKTRFKERFLATPKNFPAIAAAIDKTVAECIHFYYLTKKTEGYKALVKKHSTSRRRRAGHSDKNGPTGPSHGTSKRAPSRVSTPGGDDHRNSPHPDSKNEDGQSTTHRKGGGASTRGRSGRRGGSGDHRSTKGSGRGRSGTPVPPQQQQQSSSTTASIDQTENKPTSDVQQESSKVASGDGDVKQQGLTSSAKVEDTSKSSSSGKGATDSTITKHDASSQPEKAKEETTQTPSSTIESRGVFTTSPHPPSSTAITDTNLAPSFNLVTFSPCPRPDDPTLSRPGCSESGNIGSGILPPKDPTSASVLPAGLSEQLSNLTKTGAISAELLANIPQFATSASTQALAQVLSQAQQQQAKAVNHDQPTDPAAAAYSKAILIGDFCTAQQLSRGSTPSQQTALPTTVNMTGTSMHRAADYTDPNYLNNRTIDPSSLPMPTKRVNLGGSTPNSGSRSGLGGGHIRSPPGSNSYHHQQSLPPPPPSSMSRYRPMPGQTGSTNVDAPRQPPGRPLSGLSQGGGISGSQPGVYGGGDTLIATKPPGYYDLTSINPPPKKGPINLESGLGATSSGRPGLDPKIEEYIAHAAKLYQDEVERYTSRDRSDSMRTRTSSETSQQMHVALDNARQRVLRMAAAAVAANDSVTNSSSASAVAGYSIPSSFADSQLPNEQLSGVGVMDINEMLTKCGPQCLSFIASAAAEASSNQPGQSATEGLNLFTSRTAPPRQAPPPSLLDSNIPPHQQFTPSNTPASAIPLPRYRKLASSSSTTGVAGGPPVTFSSPPASAISGVSSIPSQREFFSGLADDSGYHLPPHHTSYHSQQIPPRYPLLMRASATRNLESVGLLPEEIARKNSTSRQHQPTISTSGAVPVSSSLVISSSTAPSSTGAPTSSFRSPESTTTAGTATKNPVSTTIIGTLQETIEKAITDGIIVQRGGQDVPKIDPSTAEAKSVKSMHPSVSLLKPESDRDTPTSRSPSAGVLTSPTMLVFPKKRSRLPSSGSSAALSACGIRPTSPSRSGGGGDVPTPTGSAPSASPALSTPEERARTSSTSKSPTMVPPSGITPISPPSSADSPGNLQIFIPPEEEPSQFSPHHEGRHSTSLSRQTSNLKSSIGGGGGVTSPTHANEPIGVSPRQHNPPLATSPPQQQQQQSHKTPQSSS
nr:nuclear receptor corepressor,nuclear receptor co repressor related (ncor) [Hymenolepis microstoma]